MGFGVVKSLSKVIGDELYDELCDIGNLYLIGGSLRDFKRHKNFDFSRDIDVVIDVRNEKKWENFIAENGHQQNKFGGYKIRLSKTKIDIWQIDKTWAYVNKKIACDKSCYVSNLKKTVFFNIDAILYDITQKRFYDYVYKKAIEHNLLDIVLEDNPEIDLNISRAIVLKNQYSLRYSDSLIKFIKKHGRNDEEYYKKIYNIIKKRYNGEIIKKEQVQLEIQSIFDSDDK
ncbi:hypothetical protein [Oribacterium sp. FC2011]|uniref:hypothetical protein n=1 Tax=Oribacterium sp. FC2011 TaxID=1408311 RepID=UPI00067856C6|nr:hypothetical protein [Oribacterium sp. FC2011]